jgi:predicted DNA-binding transcriptional regulator AlpA
MVTQKSAVERQTVNLPDAFKMLGISRPVGYELARRDDLPVPVIRLGNRMVVSKRALEAVLSATKHDEVA